MINPLGDLEAIYFHKTRVTNSARIVTLCNTICSPSLYAGHLSNPLAHSVTSLIVRKITYCIIITESKVSLDIHDVSSIYTDRELT